MSAYEHRLQNLIVSTIVSGVVQVHGSRSINNNKVLCAMIINWLSPLNFLCFFMYGTSIGLSLMTKAVFYAFGQIIALVADLLLIYLLFSLAVALKSPTIVSTFWKRGLNAIRALSFLAGIAGVGWKISSSVYYIYLLFGPAKITIQYTLLSKAGNYIIILAIASIQLVFIHQLQPNATKKVGMYLQLFFKQSRLVITVIVLTIAQIGHGFPPFSEIPDIVQFFGNNLTIGLRAVICLHFLLKLENEKKSTVSNHKPAHANEMLCKPSITAK